MDIRLFFFFNSYVGYIQIFGCTAASFKCERDKISIAAGATASPTAGRRHRLILSHSVMIVLATDAMLYSNGVAKRMPYDHHHGCHRCHVSDTLHLRCNLRDLHSNCRRVDFIKLHHGC